jgi:putative RNA 2'-phosphotransferase
MSGRLSFEMNKNQTKRISKFLSLILRHRPETVGLVLDESGWVDVEELLSALGKHSRPLDRAKLEFVVANNDKQRFSFSPDGLRIRANQGHSLDVELGYAATTPPDVLFHGAPSQVLDSIFREGLKKMKRHHVHLHTDKSTCRAVALRRGRAVLLTVDAAQMHDQNFEFFQSQNGVWLTDHVPPEFFSIESE